MTTLEILARYRAAFLAGLGVTIRLFALVSLIGLIAGIALGTLAAKRPGTTGRLQRGLAFVLGGIPILVFLFWAHFPLQQLLGVVLDPFFTASVVLSVVNVVAISDSTRSVLDDFPTQYVLAARSCGLSSRETFARIELPIIARQLIPTLLPIQVSILHATLFASLISVEEVFRVAQRINAQIYRPVQIYTALALFFLAVSLPVNGLAAWLRRRFTRSISET